MEVALPQQATHVLLLVILLYLFRYTLLFLYPSLSPVAPVKVAIADGFSNVL